MSTDPSQEETIFNAAVELSTPEQRLAYIRRACGADSELLRNVEALLRAYEEAGGFLNEPAARGALAQETPAMQSKTAAVASLAERPGQRIGRYKLLEKIGEGGFGDVWMAEQGEPVHRRVALKIIKLGMDTKQVVARFEAERQALAMMEHPNIARIFDGGVTESGRPYFVMELVRGVPITEYCDQGRLTPRQRLELFIQVCQAVQHAHQKGLIHRDLKPSNILVTLDDLGVAVPKIIDFGITKAVGSRLTDKTLFTRFHEFIGTPAYMSPEQAALTSLDIDTRSDIYSLGVLLYELLTGRTPFDTREVLAAGLDAMRRTICHKEPPRPSTRLGALSKAELTTAARQRGCEAPKLLSTIRGDLDWIVMKCLEKDRARRYETTNGLARDVQRHLANEAVVARPPSAAYKFQKLVRRNKLVFAATAAVAVALVAGIGVSTWQALLARKAQREAESARNGERQQRLEAQSAQKAAESERERADTQAWRASENERVSRRLLYASDINLAQQALRLNNVGRARRLLDRHRPQPGDEDLRGWEWRYLWQLTRSSALVTLTNRPVRGFSLSFSPDGTRLAVGWFDGRIDLWDVAGRRCIRALTDREYSHQGRVAFSPIRNLLAATSEPELVILYDLDSGSESILWRAPDQGTWDVRDLAFSQDGSRVVIYAGESGQSGDSVSVVNVSSCEVEYRHSTAWSDTFHHGAARLSPDVRRLYFSRSDAANSQYSIQCINLPTGKELWETERKGDYGLTAMDISPDGRLLASGSGFEDPTIRVWDAATGQLVVPLYGHAASVCKLAFTKDGRRLISAAGDQSIRIWDTSTWTETRVLRGHTDEVHAVAFSEPAQLIASASKDGDLMLWNAEAASASDGYTRLARGVDPLPLDRSRLLLLSPGKPPQLTGLGPDAPARSAPELGSSANVLGWLGSNILYLWNGSNQIIIHEYRGGDFVQRGAVPVHSDARPSGMAYHPKRQLLAWSEGRSSATVCVASLRTLDRRMELRSDIRGLVPFDFSDDGTYLCAATVDALRIWRVESAEVVLSINEPLYHAVLANPAPVLVAVFLRGDDHEVVFFDLTDSGREPRRVPGRNRPGGLAVSPDGGLVAVPTRGGQILLFHPDRGELVETLHAHIGAVFDVSFSRDGRRLISVSGNVEAVKLWDVNTRQELLTLPGSGSFLHYADWSFDGELIVAGNNPWQIWRAPSLEEIAQAESEEQTSFLSPAQPAAGTR